MDLYLVRHARPVDVEGICYGRSEVAAPFSGEQVSELLELLPQQIERTYSSPRFRCLELANSLHIEVQIADELAELDFGLWELKSWNEIGPNRLDEWIDSGYAAIHEGESITEFDARTRSWLKQIERLDERTIVGVTHAGTIRSLLRQTIGLELEFSLQLKVEYLQPIHLKRIGETWQLFEV